MAERHRPGQFAGAKALPTSLVRDHRANHLVFGHLGRLTYVSANNHDDGHDDDVDAEDRKAAVGKLLTNRSPGLVYTFQEVARFQEWYPPTAVDVSSVRTAPNSYLNKLLVDAPEALEGMAGPLYAGFLQEALESELYQSPRTRLPLLSYGEITDMSGREPVARPALAMPTGQSGNALRIVQARAEDWGWSTDGSATMKLTNIDPEDEGHWCDNALTINQIKFTTGSTDYVHGTNNNTKRPLRWILVQTAAETIIFQPTLHGVPVQKKHCSCHDVVRGLTYITADPFIRIATSKTGGRAHCDVAFNPATETNPPQIAIIDEGGQWTIWNITGSRHTRKTGLLPFLHTRGTVSHDPAAGPPVVTQDLGHLHRILWLPKVDEDAPQSNTLLVNNATSVSTTAVEKPDGVLRTCNAVHSIGVDIVLDVQVSPVNTAHVFVLTTTNVFWLDLSPLQAARASGVSSTPSKSSKSPKLTQPLLLLSCPHLRGPDDKTLKISVAKAESYQGNDVAVVLVYSMKHPEVAVFWFQQSSDGEESTFQQQVFQLARPRFGPHGDKTKSRLRGQQTMVLLPKIVQIRGTNPKHIGPIGCEYAQKGVTVLQILTLGADLSFWSSLCVSSSGPKPVRLAPFPPVLKRRHSERQGKTEKRWKAGSRYLRKSFVVSDGIEEHLLCTGPLTGQNSQRGLPAGSAFYMGNRSGRPVEVYNMARLFNLLNRHMDKAAKSAYEATDMVRGFQNPSPLDIIRQILDIATEHGSFAYTTLLNISNYDYILEYGADLTDYSWTRQLAEVEIGPIEDSRVSISNQMLEGEVRNGGASTLYDTMAGLCLIDKVGDGQGHNSADARRQGLLAFATVQLFFSQISMVVMPRQMAMGGSARTTPGVEDGGLSSASTPYSAHFPRSDAESRFRNHLSSSPALSQLREPPSSARGGIPAWLPSSSQDDGKGSGGGSGGGVGGILPSLEGGDEAEADSNGQVSMEEAQEDPVVARLRQYAKSIRSEPTRKEGELRLLSHWQLGSDPEQFQWVPLGAAGEAEEELRRRAQEAQERRRRRMEKRAIRDRDRLLMLGGGLGGSSMSSPAVPRIQPSSQILPSQIVSSQVIPGQSQSQMHNTIMSSQVMPSSQPTIHRGGPLSQRPKKKKKPKVARGFK
ncbi:uncharacterized protein SPSK_08379 [Sporothrix schenckii 1099-18]|uniref:Uncharacterized protein n=2 Tax=Sporothrix schenckii TaxID=29908 RepID=U7PZ99_SPOS1|nr:uncharacterized protein SPSK_08379 [Sporothrix schenckii 1099-18]ERT00060.1 hypothetical protein HMPREF1624_03429 [Sporothrix schenckii ATCC 58251]KJR85508.1 hypothetical protein SPSK_08379 [Sporothrix schenckii 1099-18]